MIFLKGNKKNKLFLLAIVYILFYYKFTIKNTKAGEQEKWQK